jgi:aspartate aminotransferase
MGLSGKRIQELEGITCYNPRGAFYVFPNFNAVLGRSYKGKKIMNSTDLTTLLLEEFHTAVVPEWSSARKGI